MLYSVALANILVVAALIIAGLANAKAQGASDIDALNQRIVQLYGEGKYPEATAVARQALALAEQLHGPDHPDVARQLSNLGQLYSTQGHYAEAEPAFNRAVAIFETALGPDNPAVGTSLDNLAALYQAQGLYAEAEPVKRRALAILEQALGPDHPDVANALNNLAVLYYAQNRGDEAEPLYRRAIAIAEKVLGPDHPDLGNFFNGLGALYKEQGRHSQAEPLYRRAIAVREKALGPDHPDIATPLSNLAGLYRAQGRNLEAEPLLQRAFAIREKAFGSDHPDVAASLNNLADVYRAEGRDADAEPLHKRALAIREKALGPDHPDVAASLDNLAGLYLALGRPTEAKPLHMRALAIRERTLGPDHPDVAVTLGNLAVLSETEGRPFDAEPLHQRALVILEKAFGPGHPDVASALDNLAFLYFSQDRYADAEPFYRRSLAIREQLLGPDHPDVAASLSGLAALYFMQRDWPRAAGFWRRSNAIVVRRVERAQSIGQALTGEKISDAQQSSWQFRDLVRSVLRLVPEGDAPNAALTGEMFETAQWALGSEAAQSVAQMAARGAKGNMPLATLIRERQDLVTEWLARDRARSAAIARAPERRHAGAEAGNAARLAAVDMRIAEIDERLAAEFPDYAALASPAPLSLGAAQAQLGDDEALVLFLDTPARKVAPEETSIWVVTRMDARWVRSDLGTAALGREVRALRCGLDREEWLTATSAAHCGGLLGFGNTVDPSQSLPFDVDRAHALYRALFGKVEDLIKGKHLLIVPSGPLTQLPFQVLVTAPGAQGDLKGAAWLARDHALTVLPAVSSLQALRRVARPSAAAKPMAGFGNPLLNGPDSRYAKQAQRARDAQRCRDGGSRTVAGIIGPRGVPPIDMVGGLADVAQIRTLAPLPETADELCDVAGDLRADAEDIRLGARATEREVKALSDSGRLADYRVVHFATHGAMADQLRGSSEPGLILTPPAKASSDDDGYLSASEIAGLKLDADWVILSACNTAAGDAESAQALSGLARAFFYAQARAVLVSHWAVDSEETVKLITSAMRAMSQDRSIGRAEALRHAMLELIDKGEPHEAHPAYWAPFILVGEGAR